MSKNREISVPMSVFRLGRLPYAEAFECQQEHHRAVLESREGDDAEVGRVLVVEHDPVITVSRRPSARANLIASPELLASHGVAVEATDRGGDITYHGPGQLVVYPILDLNAMNLRLHDYMRLLEEVVIRTVGGFGVDAVRDPDATGVWVTDEHGKPHRKIGAMGVRVRRWVTMHGLSLNVSTNLEHFGLIVPCGLAGRPVTSLSVETQGVTTSLEVVTERLIQEFEGVFGVKTSEG